MISIEDINSFLDFVLQTARENLLKDKGVVSAGFLLMEVKGKLGYQTVNMAHRNDKEKVAKQEALKEVARVIDADGIVVVDEAWVRLAEPNERLKLNSRVSEDPKRKEAIVISVITRQGYKKLMYQLFSRKGKDIILENLEQMEGAGVVSFLDDTWSLPYGSRRTH